MRRTASRRPAGPVHLLVNVPEIATRADPVLGVAVGDDVGYCRTACGLPWDGRADGSGELAKVDCLVCRQIARKRA